MKTILNIGAMLCCVMTIIGLYPQRYVCWEGRTDRLHKDANSEINYEHIPPMGLDEEDIEEPETWDYVMEFRREDKGLTLLSRKSIFQGVVVYRKLREEKPAAEYKEFENFGKEGDIKEETDFIPQVSSLSHIVKNVIKMEKGKEYRDFNGLSISLTENGIRVSSEDGSYELTKMPTAQEGDRIIYPVLVYPMPDKQGFIIASGVDKGNTLPLITQEIIYRTK